MAIKAAPEDTAGVFSASLPSSNPGHGLATHRAWVGMLGWGMDDDGHVYAPVQRPAPLYRGARCQVTTRAPQDRPEDDLVARRVRWAGRLPFPPPRTFS